MLSLHDCKSPFQYSAAPVQARIAGITIHNYRLKAFVLHCTVVLSFHWLVMTCTKNPDRKAALSRTSRQTSFKMFQFKAKVKEEYPHTMATAFEAVKI